MTWLPSGLVMCAREGALSSTFVSTRSTVPGTLARAAALTLEAVAPVSRTSVLPLNVWPPLEWSCGVAVLEAAVVDVFDEVAAPAMVAPPRAAAPMAATVTTYERMLRMGRLLGRGMR